MIELLEWCFDGFFRWIAATIWLCIIAGSFMSACWAIGNVRLFTARFGPTQPPAWLTKLGKRIIKIDIETEKQNKDASK